MQDEKLITMLKHDLSTGGHWMGEEIENWSYDDLVSFHFTLRHWQFQVNRVLSERGESPPHA